MDSERQELLLMANIVSVITISALHQDVALAEQALEFLDMFIYGSACGEHEPGDTGPLQFLNQFLERIGSVRPLFDDFPDPIRGAVIGDDLMPPLEQSPDHVHSHPPQPDHPDLH